MIFSNISSIDPGKGLMEFLHAVALVPNNVNYTFEIVGKANNVNHIFENELYNFVKQNNLKNKVIFKGFILDIKTYLVSVDVVVLSSTVDEAFGMVLLEAMAQGIILIGTDVGGVREIIDDSYGNLIIPPNNVVALKDAMEKVANYSQEKIAEIRERNIQRAKEKFMLQQQINKMTEIYMSLCRK